MDKLAASAIAVKNADCTLGFDSLTSLTPSVKEGAGYAAGLPGTAYIVQTADGHWEPYTGEGEPTEGTYQKVNANKAFNIDILGEDGKYYDENGRTYMDDWQNIYQVPVAEIKAFAEAHPLADGQSYVIVNSYCQGTGQVCSGGSAQTMDNRNYAINYYDANGAKAVTDYWDARILDVPVDVYDVNGNAISTTLRAELKKNDGALFEDSLEMHTTKGVAWSLNIAEEAEAYLGYSIDKYLPPVNGYKVSGDNGQASRITDDMGDLKDAMFNDNHSSKISQWSKSAGFRGGYRYQSSNDLVQAENVDIIESDNGTLSNYGLLYSSSTVNLRGDQYHSIEGLTGTTLDPDYYETFIEINMNASRGINRQIYHGCPFTQAATDIINAWPGWSFNHGNSGYGAWNSRQPLWENMSTLSDYVTRIQGLLQNTETKIPVLIIGGNAGSFSTLLDYGYHYNVAAETSVMHDYADVSQVVNGVLKPDGLGTEMVVLSNMKSVDDVAFLQRMIDYANKGLTIALYNTDITSVSSVETDSNNDALAASLFAELKANKNTITVSSMDELIKAAQIYTNNTVEYASENVEVTHTVDNADGSDYYFFFNNKGGDAIRWGGVGQGMSLTSVNGEAADFDVVLDVAEGEAVYSMNTMNGEITELTDYVDNGDGTVTLHMDMAAWDTALLAVSSNDAGFSAAGAKKQEVKVVNENRALDLSNADWNLTIESWGPATDFDADAPFYATTKSNLEVGTVQLGLWKDLQIDVEKLYAVGLSAEDIANAPADRGGGGFPGGPGGGPAPMSADTAVADEEVNPSKYLSGIGYYTTTFNWDGSDGAYLRYEHEDASKTGDAQVNKDMVTEVTVTNANGTFKFDNLNQLSNRVDLGSALMKGENTITVKLTTTLRNRSKVEGYNNGGCAYSTYGLTAASVVPYTMGSTVSLRGEAAATLEDEAVYTVSVDKVDELATATLSLAIDGEALGNPTAEALNGWYIISQSYENGILTVVMGNNAGVSSEDAVDLLAVKLQPTGKTGDVTVSIAEASLSAYIGEGETFLGVIMGNDKVTTTVDYSTFDVNQDGTVNQLDITRAQRAYGAVPDDSDWNARADVNGDSTVDINDLIMILNNYTK